MLTAEKEPTYACILHSIVSSFGGQMAAAGSWVRRGGDAEDLGQREPELGAQPGEAMDRAEVHSAFSFWHAY